MDRRLLLAALAATACAGPRARPDATAPGPPVPLHVDVVPAEPDAPAGAPPLVVPGAAWLARDLDPLAAERRLVFYDPRGRGRSPALPEGAAPTIEDDVDDLEALRERLGLERLALLGWDYQGGLAVRYALAHPERVERLVLVAPLPPRRLDWMAYLGRFEQAASREPMRSTFERLERMRTGGAKRRDPEGYARRVAEASLALRLADPGDATRMRSDPVAGPNLDPDETARIARAILDGLGSWDWTGELRGLDVPTLVVHGAAGLLPAESAERYVEALPRAELLVLEDVGQMPWLEDPASFFPAVRAFLGRPAGAPVRDAGDGPAAR